ncbi:MAG: hypothetical protein IPM64_17700 [Phycisphaerales bacterium]|nr:hypothetical protein [Phycisphaerales bacterium]
MSVHADLDKLRAALHAGEIRVREAIAIEFRAIYADFELTPSSVQVDVFDVTRVGDVEHEHVVGSVRFGVTL